MVRPTVTVLPLSWTISQSTQRHNQEQLSDGFTKLVRLTVPVVRFVLFFLGSIAGLNFAVGGISFMVLQLEFVRLGGLAVCDAMTKQDA
jgi:hypothetical protein